MSENTIYMKTLIQELKHIFLAILLVIFLPAFHSNGLIAQKTWSVKLTTDYTPYVEQLSWTAEYDFEKNTRVVNNLLHFFEIEKKFNNKVRAGLFVGFGTELYRIKEDIHKGLSEADLSLQNRMIGGSIGLFSHNLFAEVSYAKSFFSPTFTSGEYLVRYHGNTENLRNRKLNTIDGDIIMAKGGINIPFLKSFEAVFSAGTRLIIDTNIVNDLFTKSELSVFIQGGVKYYIF